jgi:Fungal specific transcription factor domain
MGLHRKESLIKNFKAPDDFPNAVRCFWTIYGLDRRWSFGTGMPFALQDADTDPLLPEFDDSNLYLKHITRCNKIMSKIWSFNLSYGPT